VTEPPSHPTMLCRTHLHHDWVPARTEDGGEYMRCSHCGKDKTEVDLGGAARRRLSALGVVPRDERNDPR
jgi:hypothetical protein